MGHVERQDREAERDGDREAERRRQRGREGHGERRDRERQRSIETETGREMARSLGSLVVFHFVNEGFESAHNLTGREAGIPVWFTRHCH